MTAILLASFGGPEAPDEVIPFLERVTAGRGVPRERLEKVAEHYYALGGRSPINEQNRALIAALSDELASRGRTEPIYFGNRNSEPFFADAIAAAQADGHTSMIALATSAYSSYSGCRQYRENIAVALNDSSSGVDVRKIQAYYDRDGFSAPFVDSVSAAFADLVARGHSADDIHVFFTTHSIPTSMSATSGPESSRIEGDGLYVRQHLDVAQRVIDGAATVTGADLPWSLVFQSRSGPPTIPWLEPDINDAIRATSAKAVIVAPIGFISDHVEVIWDLDNEALATADEVGIDFIRVATPGTDPRFVSALADIVVAALAGSYVDRGTCTPECCPNARASLPVIEPVRS